MEEMKFVSEYDKKKSNDTPAYYNLIEVSAIPPLAKGYTTEGNIVWNNGEIGGDACITPRQLVPTTYVAEDLTGATYSQEISSRWFLAGDGIKYTYTEGGTTHTGDLLGDMVACGQASNILNSWQVPSRYMVGVVSGYTPTNTGGISGVVVNVWNHLLSYSPHTTVYNNKTKYGQGVTTYAFCPGSGAILQKSLTDIIDMANVSPSANLFTAAASVTADISPTGYPIFAWQYYNGKVNQLSNPIETIKGCNWKQNVIVAQGVNGSAWQEMSIRSNIDIAQLASMVGTVGSAAKIMGGGLFGGMVGMSNESIGEGISSGILGGGVSLTAGIAATVKGKQQLQLLHGQSKSSAITIGNRTTNVFRDTGKNRFYLMTTTYDDEDMKSFDTFLTRYGYNVGNMAIKKEHFWCRHDFVFIKVNSISIKSKNAGAELLDKVVQQLKVGMRIWRVAPNATSMLASGNRQALNDKGEEIK